MSEHHASEDQIFFLEKQEVNIEDFEAEGFILDIGGGGEGVIGKLKGKQVIAIDPNLRELEEAPAGSLKIIMDARELKFLDNSIPTVTSFFSLMYIRGSDHRKVFEEVYRVLEPGGHFLIWDARLPERLIEEKEVVAFYLYVKLPSQEIETGYGTRWPERKQDIAYYIKIARGVGFQVIEQGERDRVISLKLRKAELATRQF